jgi:FixJ family two-component response regulator
MMKDGLIQEKHADRRVSLAGISGFAEVGMLPPPGDPTSQQHQNRTDQGSAKFLAGAKLLIVEDEYLIGQDLAYGPQSEGIDVLGPFSTIDSAIDVVKNNDDIGAAILDLNLRGRVAFDLAEQLADKNIPFVFYTGYDSVIVPEKFRKVRRIRKPADWSEIKRALTGKNTPDPSAPRARLVKSTALDEPELTSLLPVIRTRAREITADPRMAELLVERTLERAIREIGACPAGVPMEHWLIGLLESTGIGDPRLLN